MKKEDDRLVRAKKRIARHHSIKEGMFASAQSALGSQYVSPFAIAINTSSPMVALLSSISGLLGPLSQLASPELLKNSTRKKVLSKAILIESFMWLSLVGIAILFYLNILTSILPLAILIFFAISTIALNIGKPAWFSWIGDIVDEKYRGRWFAKRNLIIEFVLAVFAISAALALDFFKKHDLIMWGFILLFSLAFIFRMLSYKAIQKQYEPQLKKRKNNKESFIHFLKEAPKNNFGKFSIFRAFLGFASSISAPLLAVYLLRNLGFTYIVYTIVTIAGTIFSLFVLEIWGKFSDKYGNYRTMILTSVLIPLIPILWIIHPSPIFLIFVPSLIGGIAWAGFNLSATNFIYDNISEERRGVSVSYYNLLIGIGVFLGAGLGAYLIDVLKTTQIEPIVLIFIIGGIARALTIIIGMPRIKEIRKIKKFDSKKAIKDMIFKGAKPTISEEVHELMSIKKYLELK